MWPSIVSGLLQTEDYAGALLRTYPGVSDEVVAARLASRMERQRRVLMRDDPPRTWFLVTLELTADAWEQFIRRLRG